MKTRHFTTTLLLLFVGISVAVVVARGLRTDPASPSPAREPAASPDSLTTTAVEAPPTVPAAASPAAAPMPAPVKPAPAAPSETGTVDRARARPAPAAPPSRSAEPVRSAEPTPSEPAPPNAEHRVIRVAYFHATARCVTCRRIEQQAHDAVEGDFAGELAAGEVVWTTVNVDEPENRHFIQDYRLYTKSVIVSELVDGREVRWKNLDQVWQLVRDQEAFSRYVVGEVRAFRGES